MFCFYIALNYDVSSIGICTTGHKTKASFSLLSKILTFVKKEYALHLRFLPFPGHNLERIEVSG